ncbi:arginine deiminase type-3 [Pyrenochaeta sp. DS3sAY3a]|nr:arginine deiminase type-3 [Pyrenochaeta sp. DS3sAY3a]
MTTSSRRLSKAYSATFSLKADIRADFDRNGKVDMSDEANCVGKSKWTTARGALFLPSIGDADRRCSKVASELRNEELGNFHDASDNVLRAPQFLAPLRTVPMSDVSDSTTGSISIPNSNESKFVRIFSQKDGKWDHVQENTSFSAADLRKGIVLGIDGRDTRRPDVWDGRVTVRFTVKDGSETSKDDVELRVAPVVVHNHLDKVEQILAVAGDETRMFWQDHFTKDLKSAARSANILEPFLFNKDDDPWAQDFVEPGFASIPGTAGPIGLRIHIRSSQDTRVAGRQVFECMRGTGVGAVQHLGGPRDEINSMGNLECTPPFEHKGKKWPAGRIIMGSHGPYEPHILPYLRAQEVQDPILLDTAWLWVGHVDEFIQFLPAKSERGWVVVVVDPEAALKMLQDAQKSGHGELPLLSRKTDAPVNGVTMENCTDKTYGSLSVPVPETTIAQFLFEPANTVANIEAGKRIKANLEILKAATGITDSEIHHLPTLFQTYDRSKLPNIGPCTEDEKLAYMAVHPATINGIVLTGYGSYLAPNPWGPVIDGKDIMAEATRDLYARLGWKVRFLDNWNSHHTYGGEMHCATNTVREMRRWW